MWQWMNVMFVLITNVLCFLYILLYFLGVIHIPFCYKSAVYYFSLILFVLSFFSFSLNISSLFHFIFFRYLFIIPFKISWIFHPFPIYFDRSFTVSFTFFPHYFLLYYLLFSPFLPTVFSFFTHFFLLFYPLFSPF